EVESCDGNNRKTGKPENGSSHRLRFSSSGLLDIGSVHGFRFPQDAEPFPDAFDLFSCIAMIAAPIMAAVRSKPRTSRGSTYSPISRSPSDFTETVGATADGGAKTGIASFATVSARRRVTSGDFITAQAIVTNAATAMPTPHGVAVAMGAGDGGSAPRVRRMAKTMRTATAPT